MWSVNLQHERISVNEISKRNNKYLYCFVPLYEGDNVDKKIHIYCCDDNQLFEYSTFEYPKEIMDESGLEGMQFTSKGMHFISLSI